MTTQPTPQPGGVPVFPHVERILSVHGWENDNLIQALGQRRSFGMAKYGQELYTDDGRDPWRDAEEELLDLIQYMSRLNYNHPMCRFGDDVHALARMWERLKRYQAEALAGQVYDHNGG